MTVTPLTVTPLTRHGPGDGVVVLDVGGKPFKTLRSTVQSNRVLAAYVERAEANQEFVGGAVFVDRDPKHFGLILNHLRNRVEGLEVYRRLAKKAGADPPAVQLPKQTEALRDLFVEAEHYGLEDLKAHICTAKFSANVVAFIGGAGSGNPFDAAAKLLARGKAAFVALAGTAAVSGIGLQSETFVNLFPTSLIPEGAVGNPGEASNDE